MKKVLRNFVSNQCNRFAFLLQQGSISSPRSSFAVTCAGKTDGGGAQWHAIVSVLAFCRAYQIPFYHTTLQSVEHGNPADRQWLQAWNRLFNFESIGIPLLPTAPIVFKVSAPLTFLRQRRHVAGASTSYAQLEHAHQFTNLFPSHLARVRPLLRTAYSPHPKIPPPPVSLHDTLVVHARRGDVENSGCHRNRYTSSSRIQARCSRVLRQFPHLRNVLVLTHQPDPDCLSLRNQGMTLDFQHDVFTHFHWMSQAGGLLIAKSSLSYLAGLLNPHLVFAERFEHPPLPDWIRLRPFNHL